MDYRQNQQYSFSYQSSPPYNGTTNDTSYIPGVYAQTPLPLQMNAYQNNQHAGLQLKSPAGYSYEPLEGKSTNRKKTWKQMHLSGWRFGTLLFSLASLVALLLNVAITIYSVSRYGGTISKDFEPIFVGNCAETKSLNTWIHLAINILSSILLSGSNYCMQVMTAPSRKDV